jgi:ribosomal protein L11 methylase PrmA
MKSVISTAFSTARLKNRRAENPRLRHPQKAMMKCRSAMTLSRILTVVILGGTAFGQGTNGIEKLAPYYPTPEAIVQKMLDLGGLKAGEKMFDLGSGDGRIVIMAAQKYHAEAVGVEMDKDLYKQSTDKIRRLGLDKTARIINGDLFKQDYSSADLLTVYLLPVSNAKVAPMLEKQLKKGARVVAHDFQFPWQAEKVETIEDDGEGRSHTLYLYRIK